MGNVLGNFPTGEGSAWRFYIAENIPHLVVVIDAHYNGNTPQRVQITGPLPLNLTLEVDNANIEVEGAGHRICLIGTNNNVIINGSQITLRMEGENNTLRGNGQGTTLFTDQEVTVEEDLQFAARGRLTNEEGNVVDGAPKPVPSRATLRNDVARPANGERSAVLRCTYSPIAPGENNQSPSNANANGAGDANQNNAGGQSGGPSRSGSNISLSGKRGRDDDDGNEPGSKRSRTD